MKPDRILIDLPGAITNGNTQEVNMDGVRGIRTAQHRADPPVTRIVLDLDQAHPYTMKVERNRIVITVGPGVECEAGPRDCSRTSGVTGTGPHLPAKTGCASIPDGRRLTGRFVARFGLCQFFCFDFASGGCEGDSASPSPTFSEAIRGQFETEQWLDRKRRLSFASSAPPGATPTAKVGVAKSGAASDGETTHASAEDNSDAAMSTAAAAKPAAAGVDKATILVRNDDPNLRTVFRVKYVAEGVAYLEGGRAQGLAEGMKLEVRETNLPARQGDSASAEDPSVVAELEVSGLAETSAVTEICVPKRPVKAGDLAYLSSADAEALVAQRALSPTRQYPAVISFTEGDTLDEEAREEVPRPPLPSVNRARGRIGLDYITTVSRGTSTMTSTNLGFAFRGRHHAHRRHLLESERVLSRPFHLTERERCPNRAGPDQPHLSPQHDLRQSKLQSGCGIRTPLSALGRKPGHDRWRIFWNPAFEGGDRGNFWWLDA